MFHALLLLLLLHLTHSYHSINSNHCPIIDIYIPFLDFLCVTIWLSTRTIQYKSLYNPLLQRKLHVTKFFKWQSHAELKSNTKIWVLLSFYNFTTSLSHQGTMVQWLVAHICIMLWVQLPFVVNLFHWIELDCSYILAPGNYSQIWS